jgi:hypothetical protein
MKNQPKTANIIRWIARIWGTTILAFVLFFLFADIFGSEESGGIRDVKEAIVAISGIIAIIGLAIALKWEGLGGLLTIIGLTGLFIVRFDLVSNPYIIGGIAPPGVLYLIYWYLIKGQTETIEKE